MPIQQNSLKKLFIVDINLATPYTGVAFVHLAQKTMKNFVKIAEAGCY